MPSIRRTLSPALHSPRNRPHSDSSPPETKEKDQMVNSSPRSSSVSPPHHSLQLFFSITAGLRPIALKALGLFLSKPSSRKRWSYWKRSLIRFIFIFLIGFLLGVSPFRDLETSLSYPIRSQISSARRELGTILSSPSAESGLKEITSMTPLATPAAPKLLIIVTPTYTRALQYYYLHRLGQTLRLVPSPLLWIVVEMASASDETAEVLRLTGVMFRHLVCHEDSVEVKDRGVQQRNAALEHIERHRLDGIVYFADDDNIYSLKLFSQLRDVRRFGTWPVAMLAQSKSRTILEGPVCNGSEVVGWNTNEKSKRLRRFHVDMSGFALNSTTIWDPKRWHRPTSNSVRQLDTVKEGFQETTFIEQVVEDESQMEGLPHGCSMIMNWHLHLEAKYLVYPRGWQVSRSLDAVISLREDIRFLKPP